MNQGIVFCHLLRKKLSVLHLWKHMKKNVQKIWGIEIGPP